MAGTGIQCLTDKITMAPPTLFMRLLLTIEHTYDFNNHAIVDQASTSSADKLVIEELGESWTFVGTTSRKVAISSNRDMTS